MGRHQDVGVPEHSLDGLGLVHRAVFGSPERAIRSNNPPSLGLG
jgi:hypothetical protein